MSKIRESNIELLRIMTIIGVIVLHYNNKLIGGAFEYVEYRSVNFYILNILESIFVCAVNVFIIISGYFYYNTEKRNLWKVIKLLISVMILNIVKYIITAVAFRENSISIIKLIFHLIPSNYFIILYIVVYILSPYINILIKSIDKMEFKRFVFVLLIIFSVYPTCIDLFSEITKRQYNGLSSIGLYGSQYGYSIANFFLCYIIGCYISKEKTTLKEIKIKKLILFLVINVLILTGWSLLNEYTGYFVEKSALEYCNPLIISNAVIIIMIFMKIRINTNNIINSLAKASFMVYLIQDTCIKRLEIEKFVNKNAFSMLLHMLCSICVIYVIGFFVFIIYNKLEDTINLTYIVRKQENSVEKI